MKKKYRIRHFSDLSEALKAREVVDLALCVASYRYISVDVTTDEDGGYWVVVVK